MSTKYPKNPKPSAKEIAAVQKKLEEERAAYKAALIQNDPKNASRHHAEILVCQQWFEAYVN